MKQILIFISLFFSIVYTSTAQSVTANQFNGRLQMTTVSNVSDSTWSITGYFTNSVNKYTTTQVAVNDKFFCQIGANTYVGRISVINSASDVTKLITFRVICNYPNPPNNIGAIVRATSNGYPVFVDGLPNALQAGIQNYFATLINTNAAGSPCEQTITQAAHGFRDFTPVRWNSNTSTYERSTNDTIVPDYIVVDSLTANTFKVANCGTYTTSLANGLYWFTSASPGYSLTADTTKVPLFQALNGKLILNPIVGFNLMSGSGDVTSAVLADTAAAIRADFPNGIISALPLGNVNINANNNYLALSNLFGLGIGRIPTGSKLEVAGDGEFHGRGNGILYAGSYPGTGAPDHSVANTGFLYNTNSQFGLLSGPGFSVSTEMILHVNKNQKVTIRGIGDTLPGIGITLSRSTFIRDKLLIGPDSSFIHNPNTDTTFTKGTAVFGKASSLGSPTATGYSHIFRHPSSSSTAVLIESGRVSPTGGTAGVRFLPSGLWSAQIEYGSATSNALSFYSHRLGRTTLFLGSSGFVAGSPRTIIVGYSDDPGQWAGNAALVIYDTITSGKALAVFKKAVSSSTPIATFSSASNDRMTVEDDGDVKIGTGAALAKLHVVGDCIIESTIWLNVAKTVGIFSGTGTPEGVVTASVGSTFHRTNGGALTSYYVKESGSGNTGWVPK